MKFHLSLATLAAGLFWMSFTASLALAAPGYGSFPVGESCGPGQFNQDHIAELAPLSGCGSEAAAPSSRILRGGYPKSLEAIQCLKSQGVGTIISLEFPNEHGTPDDEETWARSLGITFYRITMTTVDAVPQSCAEQKLTAGPCDQRQLVRALLVIRQALDASAATGGKVFVHCKHGQDRTGLVIGALRVKTQECPRAEARQEMMDFGYHPFALLEAVWAGI